MESDLQSPDEEILNALELFHYSFLFRESIFVLAFEKIEDARNCLADLKLLQSSRIKTALIVPSQLSLTQSDGIKNTISRWNSRGHYFTLFEGEADLKAIKKEMAEGSIAVVTLKIDAVQDELSFFDQATNFALSIKAEKLFFPNGKPGIIYDNKLLSHPPLKTLTEYAKKSPEKLNYSLPVLNKIIDTAEEHSFDIILISNQPGCIFQEVFTHRGSGTLLTKRFTTETRQATAKDVARLYLILKPYMKSGVILSINERSLFDFYHEFVVQTINKQLVACAKLNDYGECCEIGKICTLPRYQRQGRARKLIEECLNQAKTLGKKWAFSLSTQESVWQLFEQIGFYQYEREKLPQAWLTKYDLARRSRAYRIDF